MKESERCNTLEATRPAIETENSGMNLFGLQQQLYLTFFFLAVDDNGHMCEDCVSLKTKIGLDTVVLGTVGVYHYKVEGSLDIVNSCSLVCNNGPRVGF